MSLSSKIDFAVIFKVNNANPNGDPLNGNRPRITFDGNGEVSDVCLKRKIRDRLMDAGVPIFIQSDDRRLDQYTSLHQRADAAIKSKDRAVYAAEACRIWYDVRAFGQVFAFSQKSKGKDEEGVSVGIRGPVSLQAAFSIEPVEITSLQITKSASNEGDGSKKSSDTMGMKHRVDGGTYLFFGSINPQLATKTGFSDEDAALLKSILPRLFENDASSARPEGSMSVVKVVWWNHGCPNGKLSSARVHGSLKVAPDGTIELSEVPNGPKPEIIEGF